MKYFTRQLEELQEKFETFCTPVSSDNVFSITKQVRSADEATSVFNKCRDCHNKWRDG